jgi:hypothetical protein
MRTSLTIAALFAVAAAAGATHAVAGGKGKKAKKQVKFVGIHPIPKAEGGGVCHIEAPHVHVYTPSDVKVQYRVHDDHHHFVGDPVAYGWDGPRHSYVGHHPVPVGVIVDGHGDHVEHCYLDGAHYHHYEPPAALSFKVHAGAYWYVGEPAPAYLEARAELDPIDIVYEPIAYERPVVVYEEPPPAWIGVHAAVVTPVVVAPVKVKGRGHGHGHGHVHGHVGVEVVAPTLSIEVGVPGVVVESHHHHHHRRGKFKHKKFKGKKGKRRGRW